MPGEGRQPDNSARQAQQSFSALDWKERARLVNEAEARQLRYFDQILPLSSHAPLSPDVTVDTVEQAQRALLLEAYYALLEATLKGQELFLAPWTATKDPDAREREAETWRRKAAEEQALVQAVQERGDWRPLKEKWRRRLPPAPPAADPDAAASAWLREMSGRVLREVRGRGGMAQAHERAHRVLALVPDETAPMRAAALDPDPPLLS